MKLRTLSLIGGHLAVGVVGGLTSARGAVETSVVNDMTGTDARQVTLGLEGNDGMGDAQPDTVVVGTTVDDVVRLDKPGALRVSGPYATVEASGAEAAYDTLTGAHSDDRVDASTVPAGVLKVLTLDGGAGDDRLVGSAGYDVLDGGDGTD